MVGIPSLATMWVHNDHQLTQKITSSLVWLLESIVLVHVAS